MIQIISDNAEDILMRFHQHLVAREGLSDATVGTYIEVIRNFASWYESQTGRGFHLWSITAATVPCYQMALHARGITPAAICWHLVVLQRLKEWSARHAVAARKVS